MSDPNERWHDNNTDVVTINGKKYSFYCDRECIFCGVCHEVAPDNFKVADEEDHDICFKQPENEEELGFCLDALESCPVEAIGYDGYDGDAPSYNRERLTDWSQSGKLKDDSSEADASILDEWDNLFDDEEGDEE